MPTLVTEDQLVTANSLSSLNSSSARLVGPALGGLIVAFGLPVGIHPLNGFAAAAGLQACLLYITQQRAKAVKDFNH